MVHTTGADTCFCSMLFLEVMLLLLVVIQVHRMLYSSHKFYLFMLLRETAPRDLYYLTVPLSKKFSQLSNRKTQSERTHRPLDPVAFRNYKLPNKEFNLSYTH